MRNLEKSKRFFEKAKKLIPDCSQTFSKGPSQFIQGIAPNFLDRGEGAHVFDVDGNEYIDFTMALGPVILGYNYLAVNAAIVKQLKKGSTFTLPHPSEIDLAELLVDIIPCAEMVRYGKNGSDVTSAAVRIARAHTGREKIACCGYHGWQDWYIGTTSRNKGVPKCVKDLTLTFEYNKIETLKRIFEKNKSDIAAVIMEPLSVTEPQDKFLERAKKLSHENGAILIFDEIVTGFRVALGGAQEYYDVTPDLACYGKGIANGMPLSVIAGKKEIMEEFKETFFSFTFGGETLSLAAAIATIKEIKEKNVIEYLWRQGKKIKEGYNKLAKEYGLERRTECVGLPPRTLAVFKDENGEEFMEMKSLFQQESIKHGILFTGTHNISYSHREDDIEKTLEVYSDVMEKIKKAVDNNCIREALEGPVVQPVFRKI